jgi:hypothetical protein
MFCSPLTCYLIQACLRVRRPSTRKAIATMRKLLSRHTTHPRQIFFTLVGRGRPVAFILLGHDRLEDINITPSSPHKDHTISRVRFYGRRQFTGRFPSIDTISGNAILSLQGFVVTVYNIDRWIKCLLTMIIAERLGKKLSQNTTTTPKW